MAIQNHLTELERKHDALEREIQQAIAHPGSDSEKVAELKRKKLHLKDELSRLRAPSDKVH